MEQRIIAVLAEMAGISTSLIKPELRLEKFGCDSWDIQDLVEVLQHKLGIVVDGHATMQIETIWDVIKAFHRAQYALGHAFRVESAELLEQR